MTVAVLFGILILLTVGVWCCAIMGFWYGQKLLKQQKEELKSLLPYLKKIKQEQDTLKSLTVSDEMPLSRLKDITLPENVHINFSHKKTKG